MLLPILTSFQIAASQLPIAEAYPFDGPTDLTTLTTELELTRDSANHFLGNAAVWSPDGEWIVYDMPEDPNRFSGTRIEAVHHSTGKTRNLYESSKGANCGVASWHPKENTIVFILGPESPDTSWDYAFTRRRGIIVKTDSSSKASNLDAMNYAPPYIEGALRGGSHVHIFSGDGLWLSFTYEDEVLDRRQHRTPPAEHSKEGKAEINQRNIAIAIPGAVTVNRNHPRNNDGTFSSYVVSNTVASPLPGSDEISRAVEESWVGSNGYQLPDGTHQKRALAFQGTVTASNGDTFPEVFILDLPEPPFLPNGLSTLQGTDITYPASPLGIRQRRLTYTADRKYPGIRGPRHWLKSSPDGAHIAFLMYDNNGIVQIWTISPNGGEPRQLTSNPWHVASAFSWNNDGSLIAHAMDNSIFITETSNGRSHRLTPRTKDNTAPLPNACVFSPNGKEIAFIRYLPKDNDGIIKYYSQICTVSVPELAAKDTNPYKQ